MVCSRWVPSLFFELDNPAGVYYKGIYYFENYLKQRITEYPDIGLSGKVT
jgi:hypothetical protein